MSRNSLSRLARGGILRDVDRAVALADLDKATSLDCDPDDIRGRSLVIWAEDQLSAAMALYEMDGAARRFVLCPPDVKPTQLASIVVDSEADAIVAGQGKAIEAERLGVPIIRCGKPLVPVLRKRDDPIETEWALLTSGTSGPPKLVAHSFDSLSGTFDKNLPGAASRVWSTFYDIRRYGGLQIFLRAVLGGGALVLSNAQENDRAFFQRLAACGVTHISGTPSHWRRAMMSDAPQFFQPAYVRLSGEVADQAILDALRAAFPCATIAHAYASTEAGLAFEVEDGREGFPASLVDRADDGVEILIEDGTMSIRSQQTAKRYIGANAPQLWKSDGFVKTPDMIELRGDRWVFAGRSDGVVNVGGLKVHPEEVEAVINRHRRVRMSHVKGRRNPITGEIVVAELILKNNEVGSEACRDEAMIKDEILEMCRSVLPPHKVPATIRFVEELEMSAGGKLVRRHA
jgi:acyl-coenzyme A synthetase/AMP-(fatty) acid ligase